MTFHVPEQFRILEGPRASVKEWGNNGAFRIDSFTLVIASDGGGWEHVSVSLPNLRRCPTWNEMCAIKAMFWDPEDVVMQLHPRASEYVSYHPYCLHLWRPTEAVIPEPPAIFVGPKS